MSFFESTTYLRIDLTGKSVSGLTSIYRVFNKDNLEGLGEVKWFARWRQYCFFPFSDTVFEKTCLHDISEYLIKLNKEHKERK